MKNFIFFFVASFMLFSCMPIKTTTMIGDVSILDDSGKVVRTWKDVIVGESVDDVTRSIIKNFGINFYDRSKDNFVLINNAVPCIIEYKTEISYSGYYAYTESNEVGEVKRLRATNISWVTNEKSLDLPNEVVIPYEIKEDRINVYLYQKYGYFPNSFNVETFYAKP